jgi:hypothetical protein
MNISDAYNEYINRVEALMNEKELSTIIEFFKNNKNFIRDISDISLQEPYIREDSFLYSLNGLLAVLELTRDIAIKKLRIRAM